MIILFKEMFNFIESSKGEVRKCYNLVFGANIGLQDPNWYVPLVILIL